jgi:hypothetical protein
MAATDVRVVLPIFLSHNAMTGEVLQDIVLETVRKVQSTGFIPKAIVTDQGSNNVSMHKLLGVSEAKPFIGMGRERVYFFMMPLTF